MGGSVTAAVVVPDTPLARVLSRLKKVRKNGDGYMARCPAHDDGRASLKVSSGRDGRALVHCHAGCTFDAIVSSAGLSIGDMFADDHKPSRLRAVSRPADITFDYRSKDGELLYQVVRSGDKEFRQRRPDGKGGWSWNRDGVRGVLYRLPEIIEAVAEERPVFVVEGEKDVETLRSHGVTATTNSGGAGKWSPDFAPYFTGAPRVVILPDNDAPGDQHARIVAQSLTGTVPDIRVVKLPGLKPKGDVTDWFESGGTVEELYRLADAAESITMHAAAPELADVAALFQKWLHMPDVIPLYAVLGTIAANLLPGDPVWLGVVAPPSSAKTETLNATSELPNVYAAATLTPASLLSGSSKRDRSATSKGGLLKEIGEFGILVLKDFGSVLSMRPDAKAEILAALREIYDGSWTRHVGTDGGQSLTWQGKIGLIFGVTPALDSHHSVIGAMGERFLLCRLPAAGKEQAIRALKHSGAGAASMRRELAQSVAALFSRVRREPRELNDAERDQLVELASLAVRVRSTVERDRQSREIESIHGAEGPARLVLSLERLLAGLDSLGCDRALALHVVERVALDSVPPLRRRALEWVRQQQAPAETKDVAASLGLPTNTARRVLEDLAAYGLVRRLGQGEGRADLWQVGDLT